MLFGQVATGGCQELAANPRLQKRNREGFVEMMRNGFVHVVALDGGMKAWREAGFPLVRGREPFLRQEAH